MKTTLIVCMIFFATSLAFGQDYQYETPNYSLIKSEIEKNDSKFYYPDLMMRLKNYDTTLTNEEYRYLYLGYTFQPDYQAYWRSKYEMELSKLMRKSNLAIDDFNEIIRLCNLSLDENPFDIIRMDMILYAYSKTDNWEKFSLLESRYRGLIEAILSTGDGTNCSSGFHVISTTHEYLILRIIGLEFVSQALTPEGCDLMSVQKNESGINEVFFDVRRLLQANKK